MKLYLSSIAIAFTVLTSAHGQQSGAPYAEAYLASRHLIPGEHSYLVLRLRGAQPNYRPAPPSVPDTAVNYLRAITEIDSSRNLSQAFLYRVTPAKSGDYTIPPITLASGGKEYQSQPVPFRVHDPATLTRLPSGISGKDILAGWFPGKTELYQGEQCPLVLKVYMPEQIRIVNWGLPEPEKENCLAWRFSLPTENDLGQVIINGTSYLSVPYQTTLSGISPGTATFGPTTLRLIERRRVIDDRLGPRISDRPIPLELPSLTFKILPFPDGAPAGFNGAVGRFQIRAQCTKLDFKDTDSTEVILQVGGFGNLENIKPPALPGSDWKIIDTSKVARGEERRELGGVVTYRQLIRPNISHNTSHPPTSIPGYSFSYFDPETRSYRTLETPPIPVGITVTDRPANLTNNQPATRDQEITPPAEMRDIMAFIDQPSQHISAWHHPLARWWHLTPAIICLVLIAMPVTRKIKRMRTRHPDEIKKSAALKKLTEPADTRTFYRRAGRFIDQWLSPNDELNTILAERDALCFLPEGATPDEVSEQRKQEIIRLLKRCSRLSIILLTLLILPADGLAAEASTNDLNTASKAWKAGSYQLALEQYQGLFPDPRATPADILYNIGNCHYRLGNHGEAALAWRRALAVSADHARARQNLRYLELKKGSLTPKLQPWQEKLTRVHPELYRFVLHISLWAIAIIMLTLLCYRPKRIALLVTLLIIPPVTATIGALGQHYYPDTDSLVPYTEQGIILKTSSLHEEAHRLGDKPTSLPAASLVRVTARRGPWIHILTPHGESGWVPADSIKTVWPDSR